MGQSHESCKEGVGRVPREQERPLLTLRSQATQSRSLVPLFVNGDCDNVSSALCYCE